jgi:histidinol-phosphate aminotransferase
MTSRWPTWLQINDNLKDLTPYGAPQISASARLNTNENPYPLDQELQNAISSEITKQLSHLNRYPDRDSLELRSQLAAFINQSSGTSFVTENIWAANGSNEILQSIALAFKGDALGFEPSYSMHPLISRAVGKKWISVPRNSDFSIDVETAKTEILSRKPGIIFITTPNNPTGGSTPLSVVRELATTAQGINALLVVDEAYAEFSSEPSAVTILNQHHNVIVSRTMSKAFAFAGARLGYLIAQPIIVDAMLLIRLPYHLSDLTQAAARAALSQHVRLKNDVEKIMNSRSSMKHAMESLGLTVIPSTANFLLFTGFKMSAAELWEELVKHGVLIRDIGIPAHLRVTIGTEMENEAFISALRTII